MDIRQLEYFISVAGHRNFTAAAQEFYLSQPAMSHQMKKLEEELGCELLKRDTRNVELTQEGLLFLEDARMVVDILEKAKRRFHKDREEQLHLSVSYLASPSQNFLPQVLKLFRENYPDTKIDLRRGNPAQVIKDAKSGRSDVYFSVTEDMQQIEGMSVKSIQTDHYCLVTPKNHPALLRMEIDYAKLAGEPFVFMNPAYAATMHRHIMGICRQLGFTPRIVETCNVYEDVLYAVESGIGITILPYRTREYMRNNLAYTLLDAPQVSINTSLAWKTDSTNPALELFLETCRLFIREHPDGFL